MTDLKLSKEELDVLMTAAAEKGARRAVVAMLGIEEDDKNVAKDFRELRDLIDAWRGVKTGAFRGLGRMLIYVVILLMVFALSHTAIPHWTPQPPSPIP